MSKKLLIAAVIAILAIGSTMVSATESRIETLGSQGIYIHDDIGQFNNPALATANPKMLRIHLGGVTGGDDMAYGGANLTMGNITLGLYAARNPSFNEGGIGLIQNDTLDLGAGMFYDPFGSGITDVAVDWMNPFDIILGYKLGDLSLGISYYLANGKYSFVDEIPGGIDNDTATTEGKARLHSVKLGVTYKMGNMTPEAWFHYNPYSVIGSFDYNDDSNSAGDFTSETTLKGSKFVIGGRLFYGLNDNLTIVPAINYELTKGAVSWDTDSDTPLPGPTNEEDLDLNYSINSLLVGSSLQYKNDKLFVVSSASLLWSKAVRTESVDTDQWDNYELTETDKYFAVPDVALGIEYQALNWLCIRSGIHTTTVWATESALEVEEYDVTGKVVDTTEVESVQSTTASVGLGFMFGNLTVDGTLGNSFLTSEDGGSEGNLFSNLDVKYVF